MSNYLYHYGNYSDNGVYRVAIAKETPHYYFIQRISCTEKVSKKTMKISVSSWESTHYYVETPELLQKYELSNLKRHVKKIAYRLHDINTIRHLKAIIMIARKEGLMNEA